MLWSSLVLCVKTASVLTYCHGKSAAQIRTVELFKFSEILTQIMNNFSKVQ
jgi:hypothetical protein